MVRHAVGPQESADAMETVRQLIAARALRTPGAHLAPARWRPDSFDGAQMHTRMLNDRQRTGAYLEAIAAVVLPGDVVLDIGTGTGILALAAARAGARHVYAVEGGRMGAAAERMFAANGFGKRVTLLRGWSTALTLPEPADVLISEILGNDVLNERLLESTRDARARHLRRQTGHSGGGYRMIPWQVRLYALPFELPDGARMEQTFTTQGAANWREWYGFDFSPLVEMIGQDLEKRFVQPQEAKGWRALSAPVQLGEIDMATTTAARLEWQAEASIETGGQLAAVFAYFEARLSRDVTLALHPELATASNWHFPLYLLGQPQWVRPGDRLILNWTYPCASGGSHLALSLEGARP